MISYRLFSVVQFIDLPFEDIDDYVCVPTTWVVRGQVDDHIVIVAYPKDEDPYDTRDRARRKEMHDDEWWLYMAEIKYETDTYDEADFWIATRNDLRPL